MCLKQRLKQFGVGPFEGCTQQITSSILHTTKLAELLIYNQMECNDVKGEGVERTHAGVKYEFHVPISYVTRWWRSLQKNRAGYFAPFERAYVENFLDRALI